MHIGRAEIITIGDELLYGQVQDSNAQWISQQLDKIGIKTIRKTTINDLAEDILTAFKEAEERADIILITGGLGPTNDDLTKPCLAEYFNSEIAMNEEALQDLEKFFIARGKELTAVNRQQAALLQCSQMIRNTLGTAAGMWIESAGKVWVSLPGVPHEMRKMMADTVLPRIKENFQCDIIHHRVIRTIGIGESLLAEMIKGWEAKLPPHIKLAYLPDMGQVNLRLTGVGENLELLKAELQAQIDAVQPLAGEFIYGYDEDEIETVVGKILLQQKKTVALAESCTGGYVSHKITLVAGSSAYFRGSVIPYHNDLKSTILGISRSTLQEHGAVSEETIHEMANLVREKFNADIGLATSGIAGPGGGTPEKPVGTVWIAYADGEQTITRKLQLWKDREINIKGAAIALLNLTRISLTNSIEIK